MGGRGSKGKPRNRAAGPGAAPSPAAPQLEPPPTEQVPAGPAAVRAQITDTCRALLAAAGTPAVAGFVSITDLRAALPGISRADLDAALDDMYVSQEINLVARANQEILTSADRAAALHIGGKDKHLISLTDDDPAPGDPR